MRILAIRGENLASLYGKFELPLDTGPIASAGLFSISGPTGSGKSTLMDALCLALFGKTPRLGERGRGVMVGREGDDPALRVEANDERDLVSRGTPGGFAEVDFEGIDGKRYRSRWSAHRARGKPGGKFQAARVQVIDLASGDAIAGTVREREETVPRLLGYSFEEFRRAVVLPQFEFTAFLKATSADRANILERVTGTDIYTRLSVAAFQRSSNEGSKLEDLQRRMQDIQLLSPLEQEESRALAGALASEEEGARARSRIASEAVRWHETDERNQQEVAAALVAVERARAGDAASEGLRTELAQVENAEGLRGVHDHAVRSSRDLAAIGAQVLQAEESTARDDAARVASEEAEKVAASVLAEAGRRLEETRPEIAQARVLDAASSELRERAAAAAGERKRLEGEASAARDASALARKAVLDLEARRDAASTWLAGKTVQAVLSGEWPRWEALLRQHARHLADIALREDSAEGSRKRLAAAVSRRTEASEKVARLDGAFESLERIAHEAEAAAAGDDLSSLRNGHGAADSLRTSLADLSRLAGDAARAKDERAEASKDLEEAEKLVRTAAQELLALEKRLLSAQAALDADKASLDRTRDALSLEEHRDNLQDGVPCPLCGATDHPYSRKAPAETLLRKQKQIVLRGEETLAALRKEEADVQKRATRGEERVEAARALRERHEGALGRAIAEYARLRERAAIPGVPARAPDAVEKLAKLVAEAEQGLASSKAALDGALERKQAAEAARKDVEARRKEVERERKALSDAERDAERAGAEVVKAEEALRSLLLLRDGAEGDLDPALSFLGDWRTVARADPVAFHRTCAKIASDHAAHVREAAEAEQALGPRRTALEGAKVAETGKALVAAEASAREAALVDRLASRQVERAALLGGRPASEVEGALVAAEKVARKGLDDARGAAESARVALARTTQELKDATSRHATAAAELSAAEARLGEALLASNMDRPRLEALLARGQEWVRTTRTQLEALARAVHEAASTHGDRVRRATLHSAEGRPAVSREAAAQEVLLAEQSASEAKTRLSEVQFRLRADEEGRARSASLALERDAQMAVAARWRAVSDLIGSSDGKKFRSFAQGLTLDALLRQANHHLLDLAPRYQIMRVPGQDLELQVVDRDLGDEVRSVNGLSGGESFLVSLALALALASIATRVTQSRTLFIDEGFGTLDRDTLEHAMVALESLRASGRTVGVISHVPELHERIGVRVEVERTGVGRSRVVVPE